MSQVLWTDRIPYDRTWYDRVRPSEAPHQAQIRRAIYALPAASEDSDGDGIPDVIDNCPSVFNPNQIDRNGDGIADACPSQQRAQREARQNKQHDALQETPYGYTQPSDARRDLAHERGNYIDMIL